MTHGSLTFAPDTYFPQVPDKSSFLPISEAARQAFLRDTQVLIDVLSAKVRRDRTALEEYILLGRLFRVRGDTRRALRLHQNLLARQDLPRPITASIHAEVGFDLLDLEIKDYGEKHFQKSLSTSGQYIPALEGLVQAYERRGEHEKAADILARLVRLGRPERTHLAFVLSEWALSLLDHGAPAKARRMVDRAIRADETCMYAHLALADVYGAAGRNERAISVLRGFLLRWPTHSFLALRRMEEMHYRMQSFSSFEETLRDCLRASPDNYYIHYSLARHLKKKKRNDEAAEFLRRAFELNPLYVNAVRDRIDVLAKGDQSDKIVMITHQFFQAFKRARRFICPNCRARFVPVTWHCTRCGTWGVFDIRYELPAP